MSEPTTQRTVVRKETTAVCISDLLGVMGFLRRIMRSPVLPVSADNPKNHSDHKPEKYAGNEVSQKERSRDDNQQPARPRPNLPFAGQPCPKPFAVCSVRCHGSTQVIGFVKPQRPIAQSLLHRLNLLLVIIRSGLGISFRFLEARLQLIKILLLCGTLCCLMLGNLSANPVTAANQQQSKGGQASTSQITAGKITDKDAAKISSDAAPSRDGLERLKAWLCENVSVQWFRVQLTIWLLSGFSLGYTICKWRMEKIIARMTPNGKR